MKKQKKIALIVACIVFAAALFCGCAKKEPVFTLSQTEIQIKSGEAQVLTVSIENIGSDPYGITWESDNTEIATVKSGIVTGVSAGTATVKAHVTVYANSKTTTEELSCKVTVSGTPNLESISFSEPTMTVASGSTTLLVPQLTPAGSTAPLIWTSSDETIISVDENGLLTAHKEGTATVIVSNQDSSIFATCTVTVTNDAVVPTSTQPTQPSSQQRPEPSSTPATQPSSEQTQPSSEQPTTEAPSTPVETTPSPSTENTPEE